MVCAHLFSGVEFPWRGRSPGGGGEAGSTPSMTPHGLPCYPMGLGMCALFALLRLDMLWRASPVRGADEGVCRRGFSIRGGGAISTLQCPDTPGTTQLRKGFPAKL